MDYPDGGEAIMSSGISASLAMQASQRLEMNLSPQLIQSMELLQLPTLQLEQRLHQEQMENPALEIVDGEDRNEAVDEEFDDSEPQAGGDDMIGLERFDGIDYDWSDSHDEYSPTRAAWGDDDIYDPIANAESRQPSLVEHLESQIALLDLAPRIRRLAEAMAEKLDAGGWLTVPLEETVPADLQPPPDRRELEAALAALQTLDPKGIGSRNLSECLAIQLRDRPEASPAALAMAENHLEDLAANRLPRIARALKCRLSEVKEGAALIRTLNPRPGASYAFEAAPPVKPDLVVEGDAKSGFRVLLVSGREEPAISEYFSAMFDNSRRGRLVRERLETDESRSAAFAAFREQIRHNGLSRTFRNKYNHAQWLIKAVAQREQTMLAVARAIIDAQQPYLAGVKDAPEPLFMQEIADRVGFDVSTVSRAVKDKYIDTPLGLKPLKHFFARASSAVPADGEAKGETRSNAAVMLRIRGMIEAEDKRRPLRDNEILERLAAEKVAIKRRTLVNYREKMGFPSHSHRREH
jgi:RNA polymerase sigma-54 factor